VEQVAVGGETQAAAQGGSQILDQFGRNLTQAARATANSNLVIPARRRWSTAVIRPVTQEQLRLIGGGLEMAARRPSSSGLTQAIVRGDVPETPLAQLSHARPRSLIAGSATAVTRGAPEEGHREIRTRGDIITFIDEIHPSSGGAEGAIDAASISLPLRHPPIDGPTEKDVALERRFQSACRCTSLHCAIPHTIALSLGNSATVRIVPQGLHHGWCHTAAANPAGPRVDRFLSGQGVIDLTRWAHARLFDPFRPARAGEFDDKIAVVVRGSPKKVRSKTRTSRRLRSS
jgi:ATP-dependent Clp protease ATP-binding subunit ClpC